MHKEYLNEIWKDIKGYEGLYQVSNFGRVRSLNYNHTNTIRILVCSVASWGYLNVTLHKNGKQKVFLVHRLVAEAFIPNPNGYKEINHKDEDKTNNLVENLEWCDRFFNINYGNRTELVKNKLTNRKDKSKPVFQYDLNGNFIKEWPSIKEIVRQLNYNKSCISFCCRNFRNIKTAYGYIWKYKKDTE